MGFWSAYKTSLKPAEVDEPIDVLLHRPLGYIVARLATPTRITPNQITAVSFAFAIVAAGLLFAAFPGHLPAAGLCIFLSQIFDCADGQLARMQKSGTPFGRMLDGSADAIGSAFVGAGCMYVTWTMYRDVPWQAAVAMITCLLTIYECHTHSVAYDHYKNVFTRMTTPDRAEGDDLEDILARAEQARRAHEGWLPRFALTMYVGFLTRQRVIIRALDPYTHTRLKDLPRYTPERAAIYRKHALAPMRLWKSLYGVGLVMFGLAVFYGIGRPEIIIFLRLVVWNGILWFYLGPLQRRASRRAFEEMAALPIGEHDEDAAPAAARG
ncbi:MAG: CDP-alcohol phosphatidyltransferase family protein [Byssovorax sp.]